ncbi:MAG TPA: DUF4381 domain-containing protein [Steroidobacteraceae bacterium]|nr:DUF4381 domain-containing protein [Steroidobacteraceae bacterium]
MNTDWLAQLAPARPPPGPGWWPPAPGWWALLALALALAVAAALWWRHPHRRLRRAALGELRRIRAREGDVIRAARAIQNLLRRYALARFGVDGIAPLHSDAWLQFLANAGAEGLRGAPGESLLRANFAGTLAMDRIEDREIWFAAAEQFVRHGRRPSDAGAAR